jgi:ParB/RepB/Spo0J family partition protein
MEIAVTRKPLSWFTRRNNIRQKQRSEAELRELGKSLRERQLSPIWAKSNRTLPIGYGRLEAATLEKLEALDVVISDESVSEFDVVAIQSQENMLRQDLSDFEKDCIVERLRALCPKLMAKDVAERLHVDPSTITRLMSASKGKAIGLDEAIDAVLAAAKEIKRARDEGLDLRMAQAVWEKRLKKSVSGERRRSS